MIESQLIGVITLYSQADDGFNEDHRRIVEAIAKQIALTFRGAIDLEAASRRDIITGLPNIAQLEHMLRPNEQLDTKAPIEFALLFVDVVGLKTINAIHGRDAGDETLRHVVRQTRRSLRIGDILFRHRSDEFVVFLSGADPQMALQLASSIRSRIGSQPVVLGDQNAFTVDATVTPVSAPDDGGSLGELIATARSRIVQVTPSESSVH